MRRLRLAAPLASLLLPASLLAQRAGIEATAVAARPTLVVFITVDQLRPDYLDRWPGQLTGGLARLARGGAFFPNAVHDHATTETAPGHAATLSGRFPAHTGIVRNNAGVGDAQAPLLGGSAQGSGASHFRFRGTTLIDWMRFRDPRARALSVSRKDRGAILPLGRAKQAVFWYGLDGRFTTSTYYADTLPAWVQRFDARMNGRQYAGKVWTPLLPASAYPEKDSVSLENMGQSYAFPHPAAADSATAARTLADYPWMDELTAALALEGLQAMQLGTGPQTDLLAVSFSTTDAVGHRYGPDSKELHDQILRLDRTLGAFLDSLYRLRDSSRVVVALTADHGVGPIPELHFAGQSNVAARVDLNPLVDATTRALVARGLDTAAFDFEYGMVFMDRERFAAAHVDADSVLRRFLADARKIPGVLRADTREQLARADTARDVVARRWLHSLPPDLPVVAVVTLRPYVYWQTSYAVTATHGTPHDYDARVPVIFYGGPFTPGRYAAPARVVDIAPTLAAVLGVKPLETVDGRVLRAVLRTPPANAARAVAGNGRGAARAPRRVARPAP